MAAVVDISADEGRKADTPIAHRVLLVAPSPPPYGGMALQARQLERRLVQDGNSVTFFASNFAFPGRLRTLDRIPVFRTLLRAATIWILLWRPTKAAEIVHVLAASWLYFFAVVCPAIIIGRIRGKRIVVNYRGGEAERFFRWWGWVARPILRWAQVVTAPSEFLAGVIRKYLGIPVVIVPNILDTGIFQYRERVSLQPKLIVTRHLEEIYDIESVLRAFRLIQQQYPAAALLIAGTGSQEVRLRARVKQWVLQNVRFLGHVPHEQLPAVYDQCDILLNASRVDNFPGSLVEASAAGLVVVSTQAGGIPFIYQDGVSALLVAPGDWKGLAASAGRVLENPVLATSLARQAAAMARRCDWQQIREVLYAVYGGERESKCAAG